MLLTKKRDNCECIASLQIEVARRRADPVRFNFVARAKFEVAQLIRYRLRAFLQLIRYDVRYVVSLNFDPVTLTFDLEHL